MKYNHPSPSSPSLSSSSSSSSSIDTPQIDIVSILSPLDPFIVGGKKKKRNNYCYYDQYTNEFFFILFRDFINNYSSPITITIAAKHFHINQTTLQSKYDKWRNNGQGDIGTKDGRGRKRKLNNNDKDLIKQQLYQRMDDNKKVQNGHLVDFIMNLHPDFYPSIGFLSRLKKEFVISSRFTPVYKKKKQALNSDGDPDRVYTAVCVIAANGNKLPITIIKKGVKRDSPSSMMVAEVVGPFGNYMGLTRSGWINTSSMIDWMNNVFAKHANLPSALIMDGYRCHWKEEVRVVAEGLGIELISMPPNRTNEIQPLDVGVFGALQSMTDRDWEADDSIQNYLNDFQRAWQNFSSDNIRKAFYSALALEEGVLEDEEADKNARQCIIDEQKSLNSINQSLKMVIDAIPQS